MKKNVIGMLAILFALGMTAFTSPKLLKAAPLDSYFWYTPDGSPLGEGELPNNGCHSPGSNCAKGFSNVPAHPATDPPTITVATP